ncbi:SH3 domain-containing protein [Azospirillum soli]|uniref:SH3 domain-containing protein n=1 Tax=Azospirillum soli TaxID=1304799 RepID=UPI001AEB41A5|nr:SH3 domain-containing protein [Azospirillum soli]MBP2311689.1 SH3-like domain-containing protein [Azospirillum soli]
MTSAIRHALAVLALVIATFGTTVGAALPAAAEGARREKDPTHASGLPIPRFVTLRSGEVNARTGPNARYPIEWVFTRKEMPVEITQEFDTWRRIRDWEGSEGWVHQSMLSGKRGVVILGQVRAIRKEPRSDGAVVARAEPGVMGWLRKCQGDWCEVDLKGHRGWLTRSEVWGVYPNEKVD